MWKSIHLLNVYFAPSLCQALCWALGIQYTRQKRKKKKKAEEMASALDE